MKLDFAFICDYAEVTGKINAMGIGFDTIHAPQVPWTHPLLFLVMQTRATVAEVGEKKLEVHLIDDDGQAVIPPLKGKFTVPKPDSGVETIGRVSLALRNVSFPRYGAYSLRVALDGHEVHSMKLTVSLPRPAR